MKGEGMSIRLGDADLPPQDDILWVGEAVAGLVVDAALEGDTGAGTAAATAAVAAVAEAAAALAVFISCTFISMYSWRDKFSVSSDVSGTTLTGGKDKGAGAREGEDGREETLLSCDGS